MSPPSAGKCSGFALHLLADRRLSQVPEVGERLELKSCDRQTFRADIARPERGAAALPPSLASWASRFLAEFLLKRDRAGAPSRRTFSRHISPRVSEGFRRS